MHLGAGPSSAARLRPLDLGLLQASELSVGTVRRHRDAGHGRDGRRNVNGTSGNGPFPATSAPGHPLGLAVRPARSLRTRRIPCHLAMPRSIGQAATVPRPLSGLGADPPPTRCTMVCMALWPTAEIPSLLFDRRPAGQIAKASFDEWLQREPKTPTGEALLHRIHSGGGTPLQPDASCLSGPVAQLDVLTRRSEQVSV